MAVLAETLEVVVVERYVGIADVLWRQVRLVVHDGGWDELTALEAPLAHSRRAWTQWGLYDALEVVFACLLPRRAMVKGFGPVLRHVTPRFNWHYSPVVNQWPSLRSTTHLHNLSYHCNTKRCHEVNVIMTNEKIPISCDCSSDRAKRTYLREFCSFASSREHIYGFLITKALVMCVPSSYVFAGICRQAGSCH